MDTAERGFSFTRDGPLDMRMGITSMTSAEQILNSWPEAELARIFRDFGEERHWRAYAARVVDAREKGAIRTTHQLAAALGYIGSKGKSHRSRLKIHPATRVFQVVSASSQVEIVRPGRFSACYDLMRSQNYSSKQYIAKFLASCLKSGPVP